MKKTRYPIALTEDELQKFRGLSKEFYGHTNLTGYMSMILRKSLIDVKTIESGIEPKREVTQEETVIVPAKWSKPQRKDNARPKTSRVQAPKHTNKKPLTPQELQAMADKIQEGSE